MSGLHTLGRRTVVVGFWPFSSSEKDTWSPDVALVARYQAAFSRVDKVIDKYHALTLTYAVNVEAIRPVELTRDELATGWKNAQGGAWDAKKSSDVARAAANAMVALADFAERQSVSTESAPVTTTGIVARMTDDMRKKIGDVFAIPWWGWALLAVGGAGVVAAFAVPPVMSAVGAYRAARRIAG